MPLIDIKVNPSRSELRVFAALWLAFFFVLGRMAMWKPQALLVAACVTGVAWLVSLAFNRDFPRRVQLLGGLIPLVLASIGVAERMGVPAKSIEYVLWSVGVVGCVTALLSSGVAKTLYSGWMRAAVPVGWTVSHVILGAIYFLVFAPIGIVLRLMGHDPMERRPPPGEGDRAEVSYWRERSPAPESSRYFRQF